jgi:ribonucleoside-diphosphate reductase alpha chain
MNVIKRNGKKEAVNFNKIFSRIQKLTYGLDTSHVNAIEVAARVSDGVFDGVSTRQLDELAAETAASLTSTHPDYSLLASRIPANPSARTLRRCTRTFLRRPTNPPGSSMTG